MTKNQKYFLGILGFLAIGLLFTGALAVDERKIVPNTYLWIQGLALFVGLFALAGTAEKALGHWFTEFRVTSLWWAFLLAILTYFARLSALVDVNSVFHIDPSALPLTVISASVMRLFLWMKYPFIVISLLALLVLGLMIFGNYFDAKVSDQEKVASGFLTVSNFACCGLAALFIAHHLDDDSRKQKIYRTAQAADFVSEFDCAGWSSKDVSVLFIGPEQRRILVAPNLPEPSILAQKTAEILQPLKVPDRFPIVECIPTVNSAQWVKEYLVASKY
jgi:hypothetical protein